MFVIVACFKGAVASATGLDNMYAAEDIASELGFYHKLAVQEMYGLCFRFSAPVTSQVLTPTCMSVAVMTRSSEQWIEGMRLSFNMSQSRK